MANADGPVVDAAGQALPARVRRERMLGVIRDREFVRVSELSEEFAISEVTVRSDLDELAERQQVRRVRGGALARTSPPRERPFEETVVTHAHQKARIGAAAAAMVTDGETVILDVGTTTTAIARALSARRELRDVVVFTNGLTIALELEHAIPPLSVVVTGGTLRPLQHSLVDPMGGFLLDAVRVDTVFLGCNGVDPDGGITNVNLPEAQVKQRMLRQAGRRIVVADGSKIGVVALTRLCDIGDVDLLVTDDTADPDVLAELSSRGLDVRVTG